LFTLIDCTLTYVTFLLLPLDAADGELRRLTFASTTNLLAPAPPSTAMSPGQWRRWRQG